MGCTGLREISFPKSLEYIRQGAFRTTESLKEIKFESGLKSIEASYLFYKNFCLEKIFVSKKNSVFSSFDNCLYSKDLSKIIIVPQRKSTIELPRNVTTFCTWSFYNSILSVINVPDSVENIEHMTFVDPSSHYDINFSPNSKLSEIADGAFWQTKSSKIKLPTKVKELNHRTFYGCQIKSFDFHSGSTLQKLIGETFLNCDRLEIIHLPSTMTEISMSAFSGCSSLINVTIDENKIFTSKDGNLMNSSQIIFISPKAETIHVLKEIDTIPYYSFTRCSEMKNVTFEEGSIFNYSEGVVYKDGYETAMQGLGSFETITIKRECKTIESYCFCGCINLKKFTYEEGCNLGTINTYAFSQCQNIESVSLPPTVNKLMSLAFLKSSIKSVNVPRDLILIDLECFRMTTKLENITFDEGCKLQKISTNAFLGSNLKYLNLFPPNLKNIHRYAFQKTKLESITFQSSIERIYEDSFMECIKLREITFMQTSKEVEILNRAFFKCENLERITLPGNLNSIPNSCFGLCLSLSKVEWNGTILTKSIDSDAFVGTPLTSFEVPASVETVYPQSFSKCYNLTELKVDINNQNLSSFDGSIYTKNQSELICVPAGKREVTISAQAEKIQNNVFLNHELLEYIKFEANPL